MMSQLRWTGLLLVIGLVMGLQAAVQKEVDSEASRSSEDRAVAFLIREVPLWFQENRCFPWGRNLGSGE